MGSTERIYIDVEVYNNGEDSYESMMYMTVPQGLSYVNFEKTKDPRKDIPILCSAPTPSTNNTLKCDIGNPLPTYAAAKFKVIFQPRYGSEVKSSYDFDVTVNSTNPEEIYNKGDNIKGISLPIRVQTDIKVTGVSNPPTVLHNASLWKRPDEPKSEAEIGPEVFHVYVVSCQGPSHIENAEVTILWPSYVNGDQHFLYLLEQPFIEGPGECEHVEDVNPLGLTIIHRNHNSIIFRDESRVSTTVLDTEESLIGGGEGRRGAGGASLSGGSSYSSSSSFSGGSAAGGGSAGFSNATSHREYHSEHKRVSSSKGHSQSYNYSRSYSSFGESSRSSSNGGDSSSSSSADEYKVSSIAFHSSLSLQFPKNPLFPFVIPYVSVQPFSHQPLRALDFLCRLAM
jgi:integrin alpha 8